MKVERVSLEIAVEFMTSVSVDLLRIADGPFATAGVIVTVSVTVPAKLML